ncbi:CREB3 regulatory factor [Protopterus annectens]|uniref:CREB3 regulatory factor n=1 Tax=Protopterus annectens TaxID=7888 RepID=UPI001CFB3878|nr:CREB3 regulatory factor [Protopterus annectens]
MLQHSTSGMDPVFGSAFQNHSFSDQTLMNTDLLTSSSDPDFMYELDREMNYRRSPRDSFLTAEDCKDIEALELFTELPDNDPAYVPNWEQWDTYWEDLTKYTKLANCDIWGTKEVDFLGLDDFSSPYQDEEVICKTPTLAQLNSEDSLSVTDSLYHPDLLFGIKPCFAVKKNVGRATTPVCSSKSVCSESPVTDSVQQVAVPASSIDNVNKTNMHSTEKLHFPGEHKDYVKKARVMINPIQHSKHAVNHTHTDATKNSSYCEAATLSKKQEKKCPESFQSPSKINMPFKETQDLYVQSHGGPELGKEAACLTVNASAIEQSQKKEEHNYSLFVSDSVDDQLDDFDPDEEDGDEVEDFDDEEDHDEGFGSEHEMSDNEEEEDYEYDKDDDMSDTFSEQGCENDSIDDIKEMTEVSTRKRGKKRYFWEYSEQLAPSHQEKMLKPSEWDRETLPSNLYQKHGLHHGRSAAKKSRRTDVEDLTPNPRKLFQIGNELRKLNKVISDLKPVSELPITARPRSRKEKNKLASSALNIDVHFELFKRGFSFVPDFKYDIADMLINLKLFVRKLNLRLLYKDQSNIDFNLDTLVRKICLTYFTKLSFFPTGPPVAGVTSEFVNQVLEKTSGGDPTGGLVGLRVPTSKV